MLYLKQVFFISILLLFFSSCEKSPKVDEIQEPSLRTISPVAPIASECQPNEMDLFFANCVPVESSMPISFESGLGLYNTSSQLHALCPQLTVNVTYTYSRCQYYEGGHIYVIHNISYSLQEMFAMCPALQNAISIAELNGELISFLDLIDNEISAQLEYSIAYDNLSESDSTCESGQEFSISSIKNTCYKWEKLQYPPKDRPITEYVKKSCGSTLCCVTVRSYCANEHTSDGEPIINTQLQKTKTIGTCSLRCTHDCGESKNSNEW